MNIPSGYGTYNYGGSKRTVEESSVISASQPVWIQGHSSLDSTISSFIDGVFHQAVSQPAFIHVEGVAKEYSSLGPAPLGLTPLGGEGYSDNYPRQTASQLSYIQIETPVNLKLKAFIVNKSARDIDEVETGFNEIPLLNSVDNIVVQFGASELVAPGVREENYLEIGSSERKEAAGYGDSSLAATSVKGILDARGQDGPFTLRGADKALKSGRSAFIVNDSIRELGQPAYISVEPVTAISLGQLAFINTGDTPVGAFPNYSSKLAYLHVDGDQSLRVEQDLFLYGATAITDSQLALIDSEPRAHSYQPAWTIGHLTIASNNRSAYIKGNQPFAATKLSFVYGHLTVLNNQPSFIYGLSNIAGYRDAYVGGSGFPIEQSVGAYVQGLENIYVLQRAFTHARTLISSSKLAFLQTAAPAVTEKLDQPAFIHGNQPFGVIDGPAPKFLSWHTYRDDLTPANIIVPGNRGDRRPIQDGDLVFAFSSRAFYGQGTVTTTGAPWTQVGGGAVAIYWRPVLASEAGQVVSVFSSTRGGISDFWHVFVVDQLSIDTTNPVYSLTNPAQSTLVNGPMRGVSITTVGNSGTIFLPSEYPIYSTAGGGAWRSAWGAWSRDLVPNESRTPSGGTPSSSGHAILKGPDFYSPDEPQPAFIYGLGVATATKFAHIQVEGNIVESIVGLNITGKDKLNASPVFVYMDASSFLYAPAKSCYTTGNFAPLIDSTTAYTRGHQVIIKPQSSYIRGAQPRVIGPKNIYFRGHTPFPSTKLAFLNGRLAIEIGQSAYIQYPTEGIRSGVGAFVSASKIIEPSQPCFVFSSVAFASTRSCFIQSNPAVIVNQPSYVFGYGVTIGSQLCMVLPWDFDYMPTEVSQPAELIGVVPSLISTSRDAYIVVLPKEERNFDNEIKIFKPSKTFDSRIFITGPSDPENPNSNSSTSCAIKQFLGNVVYPITRKVYRNYNLINSTCPFVIISKPQMIFIDSDSVQTVESAGPKAYINAQAVAPKTSVESSKDAYLHSDERFIYDTNPAFVVGMSQTQAIQRCFLNATGTSNGFIYMYVSSIALFSEATKPCHISTREVGASLPCFIPSLGMAWGNRFCHISGVPTTYGFIYLHIISDKFEKQNSQVAFISGRVVSDRTKEAWVFGHYSIENVQPSFTYGATLIQPTKLCHISASIVDSQLSYIHVIPFEEAFQTSYLQSTFDMIGSEDGFAQGHDIGNVFQPSYINGT